MGHRAGCAPMTATSRAQVREHVALGGALGLHVVLLILAARAPAMRAATVPDSEEVAARSPVELSTEWIEAPELSADGPAVVAPAAPAAVGARAPAERLAVDRPPSLAGTVPAASPSPSPASSAEGGDWSFSATRVDTDVGAARFRGATGLAGPDVASTGAQSAAAAAAQSGLAVTNALLDGLTAHDIATGTSRGGPLLAAVEEAAHGADAPSLGVAVFEITVPRNGAPQVSLVGADRDEAAWNRLGSQIAALTARRQATVHLPDGAQGLRVRVRVEAIDRLVDGTDVSRYDKGARNEAHAGGTLERTGKVEDLPHAEVSSEGKVCNVHAGVNVLGPYLAGGCSPENTLPARRTVAARIMSETRL